MKKLLAVFLAVIQIVSVGALTGFADKEKETKKDNAEEVQEVIYTPHAECILVCDTQNGYKVYSKGSNASINPYGFTKILTAITVIENHPDLNKEVTVPKNILKDYDYSYGNIGLTSGEKITIKNLLHAMMMQDAGDCATALAHLTGKSYDGFIKLMNDTAKRLGANNSVFCEPAGFNDSKQKTTLDDMYKITAYALKNETFAEIVKTSNYKIPPTNKCEYPRNMFSKNKFLSRFYSEDYVNLNFCGVKEYYRDDSDAGIIARYKNGDDDLLCLIAKSDKTDEADYVYEDVLSVIEKGKGFFTRIKLIEKEEFVSEIKLKTSADTDRALIVALSDIYVRVPKDYNKELITREINLKPDIDAPLKKFEELGTIKVYYDKTFIGEAKVASYHKIEKSTLKSIKYALVSLVASVYFWLVVAFCFLIVIIIKRKKSS